MTSRTVSAAYEPECSYPQPPPISVTKGRAFKVGNVNSVEWNDGMERWSGLLEWTTGVEYWTGLLECHAHKIIQYHTRSYTLHGLTLRETTEVPTGVPCQILVPRLDLR